MMFNPSDPKHKRVENLPSDEQENFVNEEDGDGFVRKEAAESDKEYAEEAKFHNKTYRSILEKIRGKNKRTGMYYAEEDATSNNEALKAEERYGKEEEAKWSEFKKASSLTLKSNLGWPEYAVFSVEDKDFSFFDFIKKGLMTDEQLVDIFQVKLNQNRNGLEFTGKEKSGWDKKLESILGKKINIENKE